MCYTGQQSLSIKSGRLPCIIYLRDHQKISSYCTLVHQGEWNKSKEKEKQENKNMQLQRNTRELSACHEMYAIQLLSLETAFLFVNKWIKCGKETIRKDYGQTSCRRWHSFLLRNHFWSKRNSKDILERLSTSVPTVYHKYKY